MIATSVVHEIRRLLQEGHVSQRQIARKIGVSRGTVNAIARGKRPSHAAKGQHEENGFTAPSGLPVRCPGCGCRVQMPCLLCYIRESNESRESRQRVSWARQDAARR